MKDRGQFTRHRYLSIEAPDAVVKIDFLGNVSCTVKLTIDRESKTLRIEAIGDDDRCTILTDVELDIPEADTRR
jgi:hypothetical protein